MLQVKTGEQWDLTPSTLKQRYLTAQAQELDRLQHSKEAQAEKRLEQKMLGLAKAE